MNQIVINGDNIELLKNYPDNYFDAVVTDPPYGLGKEPNAEELMKDWIEKGYHEISGKGFMGKEWDAFIPQPIFWKEVYRVLKHGGHVLSFFGTRTYDWGVMSMRFAGFEVRDCIQWLYGSGFPKSHNISKALDKMEGRIGESSFKIKTELNKLKDLKGYSSKELNDLCGFESSNYFRTDNHLINNFPNEEKWKKLKEILGINEDLDSLFKSAKREIIGKSKYSQPINGIMSNGLDKSLRKNISITTSSTEAAKQWDGWGTALKPANEPIVLARKPLEKGLSVAENILKWGVGGINIDASRIGNENRSYKGMSSNIPSGAGTFRDDNWKPKDIEVNVSGRFPANIILTHHEDCVCKGTKKVKSDGHHSGKVPDNGGLYNLGLKPLEDKGNIHAQNGKEEVEDWDCHEDCPIRILDEQSGVTKSSKRGSHNSRVRTSGDIYKQDKDEYRDDNTYGDKGGASRFFYVAKASKAERNKGLDGFDTKQTIGGGGTYNEEAGAKYGSIKAEGKNFHPTVKPIKLMQYLVKMITPPNGIVLDPFCGSGTTGVACKLDGFQFVGLEQDPEYSKIADARIKNTKIEIEKQTKLWS
jgi:DNA modification methylase